MRIIPTETRSAAMNMALDEACMEAVRAGESEATIRLYRWKPSAVSFGYFQCLLDEVDEDACKEAGVDIVRRQTGGGAVYHDQEGEITYSIIAPEKDFSTDINASYEEIINPILEALKTLGIQAEFRAINDIIVENKKISGNAQTRRGGILLQHGTILLSVDAKKMFTLLTPDKSKLSDKPYIKSVESAVTSLEALGAADRVKAEAAIRKAFAHTFNGTPGSWSEKEIERASELAREKYGSKSWTAMR